MYAAIERDVRRLERVGGVLEPCVGLQEGVALDHEGIDHRAAERGAKPPQGGAPELAIGMEFTFEIDWVQLGSVDPPGAPTTGRSGVWKVRGGVPGGPARGAHGGGRRVVGQRRRPEVAEALSQGACLHAIREARYLVVLDGVAELVIDDVRILGVVHAARAEVDRFLARRIEGVVAYGRVGRVQADGEVHDAREAELVQVLLERLAW